MKFLLYDALFGLGLLIGGDIADVLVLWCEVMVFFYFTYRLYHNLYVIVNDLVLETCILAITLLSLLYSFTLCWDEKISSPLSVNDHGLIITKIGTVRISFLDMFWWDCEMWGLILLFVWENYVSGHCGI